MSKGDTFTNDVLLNKVALAVADDHNKAKSWLTLALDSDEVEQEAKASDNSNEEEKDFGLEKYARLCNYCSYATDEG